MRYWLLTLLFLTSCGVMVANNGFTVTGQTVLGFSTTETEATHEANRRAAFEAGQADAEIPEADPVDDGSTTLLSGDDVAEMGGSLLGPLQPYWQLLTALGLLCASVVATKRKKGK